MGISLPKVLLTGNQLTSGVLWGFRLLAKEIELVTEPNLSQLTRRCRTEKLDMVVLDLTPLDEACFELIKEVREEISTPLLLLTAGGDDVSLLRAYNAGADDCIRKPIEPPLLYAKIMAWLRRCQLVPANRLSPLRVGTVYLAPVERTVTVNGFPPVRLTSAETRLLYILMSRAGCTIPTDELLRMVWVYNSDVTPSALKNLVYRLRQKIERPRVSLHCIQTIPGSGYKFDLCP